MNIVIHQGISEQSSSIFRPTPTKFVMEGRMFPLPSPRKVPAPWCEATSICIGGWVAGSFLGPTDVLSDTTPKQPVRRVVIESFDPQIIWFPVLDLLKVTFSCFHCITFQGIDTFKVQLINWLIDWLPVQNYLLDPLSAGWNIPTFAWLNPQNWF